MPSELEALTEQFIAATIEPTAAHAGLIESNCAKTPLEPKRIIDLIPSCLPTFLRSSSASVRHSQANRVFDSLALRNQRSAHSFARDQSSSRRSRLGRLVDRPGERIRHGTTHQADPIMIP